MPRAHEVALGFFRNAVGFPSTAVGHPSSAVGCSLTAVTYPSTTERLWLPPWSYTPPPGSTVSVRTPITETPLEQHRAYAEDRHRTGWWVPRYMPHPYVLLVRQLRRS